jgi:hypothetical protein
VHAAHRRWYGVMWCGHWTNPERRDVDQVDVMKYNSPNRKDCADAGSCAMKNKRSWRLSTWQRMHLQKLTLIKTPVIWRRLVYQHWDMGWFEYCAWTQNEMMCTEMVQHRICKEHKTRVRIKLTQTRSRKNCHGKAVSTTYSERVFVVFVIQHAKGMRHIMFFSIACPYL